METKEPLKWFEHKDFTSLEIRAYTPATSHADKKVVTIDDKKLIDNLVERIDKISPQGDIYVSWGGDINVTELTFKSEKGDQVIEIYGDQFKTPSTSFNVENTEEEEALCKEIISLLK
jgi:hypothetical protein